MEPNELKEAQSDFDEGLDDTEERNRRIRALELDPDWFGVAKHHDSDDFGALLYNMQYYRAAELIDDHHARSDMKTLERAVKNGWKIPEQLLDIAPKAMGKLLIQGTPREQLGAAKVLVAMKAANDRPERNESTTINVGVKVDNGSDERRSAALAIARRIHDARVLRQSPGG